MLIEHTEELYVRIEELENQENGDDGRGNARENKIEGVKLNIPIFSRKELSRSIFGVGNENGATICMP